MSKLVIVLLVLLSLAAISAIIVLVVRVIRHHNIAKPFGISWGAYQDLMKTERGREAIESARVKLVGLAEAEIDVATSKLRARAITSDLNAVRDTIDEETNDLAAMEESSESGLGNLFWSVVISLISLLVIIVWAGLSFADGMKWYATYLPIIGIIVAAVLIIRRLNSKDQPAAKKSWWKFWPKKTDSDSEESGENSNPIGKYREGTGNIQYWVAIIIIAIAASVIIFLVGNGVGWFKHPGWEWYAAYPASVGIILGIMAVWAAVVALIVAGFSEIAEGYIGLVATFKKYTGTVGPGPLFVVPLVNEYFKVYLGQQWLQLNLTDEKNGGTGAIDSADGTPIGVRAKVKFRIVKNRAQLAIFNTVSFAEFIIMKMDSLIRSFLSCYSFSDINTLTGNKAMVAIFSQNYRNEDGTAMKFSEIKFGKLEEADVQKALRASSGWQAILRDWGIEILDLNIENFDPPDIIKLAREEQSKAEYEFLKEKKNVEKAEQLKLQRIQAAQARNAELDEEGKGFAKQITAAIAASGAKGDRVLYHVEKRLKYAAVEKGANAILSDGSNSRFIDEGAGFGAGEEMWLNRNSKDAPPNSDNQTKGVPNESEKDLRRTGGNKKRGEDKIGK